MIYYSSNNFYFMNEVARGFNIVGGAFDSDMKPLIPIYTSKKEIKKVIKSVFLPRDWKKKRNVIRY